MEAEEMCKRFQILITDCAKAVADMRKQLAHMAAAHMAVANGSLLLPHLEPPVFLEMDCEIKGTVRITICAMPVQLNAARFSQLKGWNWSACFVGLFCRCGSFILFACVVA